MKQRRPHPPAPPQEQVFLVEERGYTFERPRRARYVLPDGTRVHTVRDRSGAPIAVYVRASTPQEALATYIAFVCAGEDG